MIVKVEVMGDLRFCIAGRFIRMQIHVLVFHCTPEPLNKDIIPPGAGKWNRIEHRLFCHVTQNQRGKPLRTFEAIVDLTGSTRTTAGLRVKARLDKRKYPTGEAVTQAEIDALSLHRNKFHGDWNYELRPR